VLSLLHVLAADAFDDTEIGGWFGRSRLVVCRPGRPVVLPAAPGDTVSLVPIGGDTTVSTNGLRWHLDRAVLRVHSSRGVSNVAVADAGVTVHSGRLLAFVDGDAS
jgi:thiamine pyrophosphokinase